MICVLLLLVCTGVATASHVNANCDEYSLVLSVCCNECHLAAVAGRNGMTVEQVRSMIPADSAASVSCDDYALVRHACCESCRPPPPPPPPPPPVGMPASRNEEEDNTDNTVTIIAIVAATVVCIAIIVAVVVLTKRQALASTGTATQGIHSSQSGLEFSTIPNRPRGAKFDPNTGQPIPKFDPATGVQNW